jgi:hypothetical protein
VEPRLLALDVPSPRQADVARLVRWTSELLAAGVPLTLLLDLSDASGPHSADRYAAEGGDVSWLDTAG